MCRGWQSGTKKVLERCSKLYSTKKLTDCTFIFGKNTNKVCLMEAHKVILAMASPVFEAMFYGMLPAEKGPIAIEDIDPTTFDMLLKYLYTDKLDLSNVEEACSLWNAAEKYLILDLVERCVDYLLEILNAENVWVLLEQSQLFSCDLLKENCLDVISVIGGSPFKSNQFENITKATLHAVLGADQLNVDSELEVLHALERWSEKECDRQNLSKNFDNLRSVSENGIEKIRFFTMTPEEFTKGPITSSLISKDESFAILANLVSGSQNYRSPIPFPVGFSTSSNTRCPMVAAIPMPSQLSSDSEPYVFEMKDIKIAVTSTTITLKKYRSFCFSLAANSDAALNSFILPYSKSTQYTVRLYNEKSQLIAHERFSTGQSCFRFSCGSIFIPNGKKYKLRIIVDQPGSCPLLLNTVSQGTITLTNEYDAQCSIYLSDFNGELFLTSIDLEM